MTELACGLPPCPEHGGLCTYHGDEPDRCPWCHRTWSAIRAKHYHSCEISGTWWENGPTRAAEAALMRLAATDTAPRSTYCAHRSQDMGLIRFAPHLA